MANFLTQKNLVLITTLVIPVCLILFFITFFIQTTLVEQAGVIYQKAFTNVNLDDHVNSVVAGNIYRLLFPAKVRINPLIEKLDDGWSGWAVGPYWQHIPPLFAYTPLSLFMLDNKVSIEMYRLSFALSVMLTGIIFIATVTLFTRSILATFAATVASIVWSSSPYTLALIQGGGDVGKIFGVSDITLSLTVILSLAAICWYLSTPEPRSNRTTLIKLLPITALVTLPVLAKSLLGAIPIVTFFTLLLYDQKKPNLKVISSIMTAIAVIGLYYGSLFISSPETFWMEITVPIKHFDNYEYWGRPWHFYITDYLPNYYFSDYWHAFVTVFFLSLHRLATLKRNGRIETIMKIAAGWSIWNLVAVSVVTSKSSNFIYQTYLLALFLVTFTVLWYLHRIFPLFTFIMNGINKKTYVTFMVTILVITLLTISGTSAILTTNKAIAKITELRTTAYAYDSVGETFYELAEYAQDNNAGLKDIFVIKPLIGDNWLNYYILFLTGSETVLEKKLYDSQISLEQLKQKYDHLHVILPADVKIENTPYAATITKATSHFQLVTYNLTNMNNDTPLYNAIAEL